MKAQKTALITGGSSGVGWELSKLFAGDGYQLVWVSEKEDELKKAGQEIKGLHPDLALWTLTQDLSKDLAAQGVYDFVRSKQLGIDVLVNNAGFGTYGYIDQIPIEKELSMINLNIKNVYHLSRLFLKDMLPKDSGSILNIASISAFQPNPKLATYGATKSFIMNFGRAVNYELKNKGSKVRITTVCPTAIKGTAFQKKASMENTNTFDSWMAVTPQGVAEAAYKGLVKGKEVVIPGRFLSALHKIVKRLPSQTLMKMAIDNLKDR